MERTRKSARDRTSRWMAASPGVLRRRSSPLWNCANCAAGEISSPGSPSAVRCPCSRFLRIREAERSDVAPLLSETRRSSTFRTIRESAPLPVSMVPILICAASRRTYPAVPTFAMLDDTRLDRSSLDRSPLCAVRSAEEMPVSYTHLTLPTNREV